MGHLRKATIKDLNYVCKNMREIDRLEAFYQTGKTAEDALRITYLSGKEVLTIAGDNDQPMGLCGVVYNGCIWMICTDELFTNKKYRIQLMVLQQRSHQMVILETVSLLLVNHT